MVQRFSAEIQKRIDALPADIRNLVLGAEIDAAIQEIGRKHGLHIDQMGALEAETIMVMVGMVQPEDFEEAVGDILDLDQQKSALIAKDVNEKLFVKIRESMKKPSEAPKTVAQHVAPTIAAIPQPPPPPRTPSAPPPPPKPALSAAIPVSKPAIVPPAAPVIAPKPIIPPPIAVPPPAPKPAGTVPAASAAPVVPLPSLAPAQKPAVVPPAAPKSPAMPSADVALTQKTVTPPSPSTGSGQAKPEPPKPGNYKADPYREPVE